MNIEQLWRCKLIFDEIDKKNYPTLNKLTEIVNEKLVEANDMYAGNFKKINSRTLQRDIKVLNSLIGIEIRHNTTKIGYEIIDKELKDEEMLRFLDAMNLLFVSQNMESIKKYIHFEPRKVNVSSTYIEILSAIKKGKKVRFLYNHYEKKITERIVSPLGLKEFKGFWYLICKDEKGIKTFGLERIENLSITSNNYVYPKDFSMDKYYEHCYGIVRFSDEEPQEIKIKLLHVKAHYYEANPLHKSQRIEKLDDEFSLLTIYVYLTYDLQQELRSHVEGEVIVLKPENALVSTKYY